MIITKLERQKGLPVSYHLYSDDIFIFSILEDTLVHFGMSAGSDFNDEELNEIRRYDQVMLCREEAFKLLKHHSYFGAELKRKLDSKKFAEADIIQVMDYLYNNKFLNDADYLKRYIIDEIRLKRSGPLLIKKKLYEKGVSGQQSDELLRKLYPANLAEQNARQIIAKKKRSIKNEDSRKLRQKLAAYLLQRGYGWEIINDVLRSYEEPEDF